MKECYAFSVYNIYRNQAYSSDMGYDYEYVNRINNTGWDLVKIGGLYGGRPAMQLGIYDVIAFG